MMVQIQNSHQACIRKGTPQRDVITFSVPKTGRSRTKAMTPSANPEVKVHNDASFVPRRHSTPHRNTTAIGGETSAAMALTASKILEKRPPWVDQAIASSITTTELTRPTVNWARS